MVSRRDCGVFGELHDHQPPLLSPGTGKAGKKSADDLLWFTVRVLCYGTFLLHRVE